MAELPSLDAVQLKQELDSAKPPTVLDVREPHELDIARLPGTLNIPMGEIAARLDELDPEADLVVMCHAGGRSARVAEYLIGQGFRKVRNLSGGITGWANHVDPSMRTY